MSKHHSYFHRLADDGETPVPMTFNEYGKWSKEGHSVSTGYGRIGSDRFPCGGGREIVVSTGFLGINVQFGDGPPLFWETMIFTPNRTEDPYQERYTSAADAREGHARAVEYAKERWTQTCEAGT